MRIRSGDNVLVIAGKEKGKTGRVDRQLTKDCLLYTSDAADE